MKKYKSISKEEYLDQIHDLIKDFKLTEEEKKEVDIFITEYSNYLQKINEIILDKSKVKKLSKVVKNILED